MRSKLSSKPFSSAPQNHCMSEDEILYVREAIQCDNQAVSKDYLNHYGFNTILERFDVTHRMNIVDVHLPHAKVQESMVVNIWHQKEKACATVCVFHGLFDHTGLYLLLIRALVAKNYNVVMPDYPGHGLSSGKRAFITSFNDYAYCTYQALKIAKALNDQLPCYAVGQSTGGGILLNMQWPILADQNPNVYSYQQFEKVILLAPLIYPVGWRAISFSLFMLGRWLRTTPRKFSLNSHNAKFHHFIRKKDPLQPREISIVWTKAMRAWIRSCTKVDNNYESANIQKQLEVGAQNLFVIQGLNDGTVDVKKNIALIKKLFPQAHFLLVEHARHHLVNESSEYRDEVFIALTKFLEISS